MKVLIVGPGAVGSIMGYLLLESGFEVHFFHPDPEKAREISEGLTLELPDGSAKVLKKTVLTRKDLYGKFSVILFTVKAYHLRCAIDQVLPAVDSDYLIFMQNGLGHVEIVSEIDFPRDRIFFGVTTNGGYRMSVNRVRVTNIKGTTMISSFEENRALPDILNLDWVSYHPSYKSVLWTKAIINAAINPLTAILEVENGKLLNERNFRIVRKVVEEITALTDSLEVELLTKNPVEEVKRVIKLTYHNRSSMLQDIERGVRTENDYISGYIVKLGKSAGIEMPANEALYNLVKIKEGVQNEGNTGSCQ